MFEKVADAQFISGEHAMLRFWVERRIFDKLREQNAAGEPWSFLDGPITANNPMGVHHAWGRTYKDVYQRYHAMNGRRLRYQNGFDCQGLWVEVEVEKEFGFGTKKAIEEYGIDQFVNACKQRVLKFAARQTEQSIRLGYWMDWDDPDELRRLSEAVGSDSPVPYKTASGDDVEEIPHRIVERLGNPEWGGSYFTFSTENNETIWTFLKKCFERQKVYRGHDVMPWSGRGGSAYSQMEVADGRKLTVHRSVFVRLPLKQGPGAGRQASGEEERSEVRGQRSVEEAASAGSSDLQPSTFDPQPSSPTPHFLLVWTTTPWTLTSNVAAAVNPQLDYVQLRAKRDGAVVFFAAGNREYQRLGREFKEGFGRPEWSWPEDVPKLKTIAQIFKEQGGFEILGTVKGSELVGLEYDGPFDDLPAQQTPGGWTALESGDGTGYGEYGFGTESGDGWGDLEEAMKNTAAAQHRVIDGGRDSRGNANVVAGEGTGIVHIAPGCGDIDHKLGEEHGLVGIAPLLEDGTFGEGFGEFTGREAIDPETAELVFEKLRGKGMLLYVEQYPHIYPHCWRTGDELVFRLVDEWFINMDWREEIKQVTRAIDWLPASVDGQERELEWLENMRDWMVSKKRFWGLALPIWINPKDPSDFEVIGSLAELKERAVEGWEEFEGHSPHRPWIDGVKIRSKKTNATLQRIPDVGNPWLDAGIVPFSTMHYNSDRYEWEKWYPADFVTECFPGQFRNWFYAMLSMATMMRHDETGDPSEKRPFKTLLGHRLVMDEHGQPMHKSDGTAIWFEEAAEQIGVDTLRWMYLAQNPAQDLRFGLRHPDQPVTIDTPEGPINQTREGLPTCKVTSTPADEVRRQILIPLWNSYSFFVNYARLDGFDPHAPAVPVDERPEIDRWILSNLQALIGTCRTEFGAFNVADVCRAAAAFIDDLSNWYIRRNRRRFWRKSQGSGDRRQAPGEEQRSDGGATSTGSSDPQPSTLNPQPDQRSEVRGQRSDEGTTPTGSSDLQPSTLNPQPSSGSDLSSLISHLSPDSDKLAAYQTLYSVLTTLTELLAPCVPFLAERMYQNLVAGVANKDAADVPESVHLCAYPRADESLLDPGLNERMAIAQLVVKLGHKLREEGNQRVRQPLAEMRWSAAEDSQRAAVRSLSEVIAEELNVKQLTEKEDLDDLVSYSFKPNLKTLGPKYGKLLGAIRQRLPEANPATLEPLRRGETITWDVGQGAIELQPGDVLFETQQAADWVVADDRGIQIALSTALSPELIREGLARDFVRQVQQARKDADLEIEDRIRVHTSTADADLRSAIEQWSDYIQNETLAEEILWHDDAESVSDKMGETKSLTRGKGELTFAIERQN